MIPWGMHNWSNEELLNQIITRANQGSIISESNELHDMRREMLERMILSEDAIVGKLIEENRKLETALRGCYQMRMWPDELAHIIEEALAKADGK